MISFSKQHNEHNTWQDWGQDLAPDLTPMIDILFILIVFFMLVMGTPFQALEIVLPKDVREEAHFTGNENQITLEIRQGAYVINEKRMIDFAELQQYLQKLLHEKPEVELIIASDKDITIEALLKVLTYLESQGITTANILMQKEALR